MANISRLTDRKIIGFAIVWDVIFTALIPIMNMKYDPTNGLNLTFASLDYRATMYLHGLIIAYVATIALAICELFSMKGHTLQGRERTIVRYSSLVGIVVGGIGGILNFGYISASGLGIINDAATWVQVVAFFLLDEIAVALIYFLIKAPKVAGVKYKSAGLAFYLLLLSIISALIAAIMGHIGGFVIEYGNSLPSWVTNYISWLGLDVPTFAANLVGSHSHEMAVALMAIIVGLAAGHFGYSKLSSGGKSLARLGLGVAIIGVIVMTFIYVISGVYNYAIPALFTSANGVNGIALDDICTGIVGLGAVFVAIALIGPWYTKVYGSNPIRTAVVTMWGLIIVTVPVIGYYVEMNETFFGAGGPAPGAASDSFFTGFHQQFAFFVLPALVVAVLALDFYVKSQKTKTILSYSTILGSLLAFIGGIGYAFASPSGVNVFTVFEYVGAAVIALSAFSVALYLFGVLKDGQEANAGAIPPSFPS